MERIGERLPQFLAQRLAGVALEAAREVRVRLGQPVEVRFLGSATLLGEPVTAEQMGELLGALTGHSVYACERQMREGFFTLPGGLRVGVAGRYPGEGDGAIQVVTSVAIRLARPIDGQAAFVVGQMMATGRAQSTLILSAPCLGKTTLLRALIVRLSGAGLTVAVADERDEIAGGTSLGVRVDVSALSPKRLAIPRMVRSLAPDVVATDELGDAGDAAAVLEAARCGCAVLATVHAASYESACARPTLHALMRAGVFERFVELGGAVGRVARILDAEGAVLWTAGPSD
ncbi:MAG: ATPase, T2SS/T4P/T4SS family [Clostridia bacterium]